MNESNKPYEDPPGGPIAEAFRACVPGGRAPNNDIMREDTFRRIVDLVIPDEISKDSITAMANMIILAIRSEYLYWLMYFR